MRLSRFVGAMLPGRRKPPLGPEPTEAAPPGPEATQDLSAAMDAGREDAGQAEAAPEAPETAEEATPEVRAEAAEASEPPLPGPAAEGPPEGADPPAPPPEVDIFSLLPPELLERPRAPEPAPDSPPARIGSPGIVVPEDSDLAALLPPELRQGAPGREPDPPPAPAEQDSAPAPAEEDPAPLYAAGDPDDLSLWDDLENFGEPAAPVAPRPEDARADPAPRPNTPPPAADFDLGAMLAAEFRSPTSWLPEAERAARLGAARAAEPARGLEGGPAGRQGDIATEERPRRRSANPDISATSAIAGFLGACLVDSETGLLLASEGGASLDLEAAAAASTDVLRAESAAIASLGLADRVVDVLMTTGRTLQLLRPLESMPTVFLYVALDRAAANLGMARRQMIQIESGLGL